MSKCIEKNLVLKGLEITLELTIGNFDQDCVDNWCTNLKHFFHCLNETDSGMLWQNRTEIKKNINETERILKQQLKKDDYEEIKNTVTSSKTTTKKFLQQLKFKKFTSLKHKPKSAVKTVVNNNERSGTTEEQPRLTTKSSYEQALKSNTNTFEKKKFNKPLRKQTQQKHKWKIKITQHSKSKTKTSDKNDSCQKLIYHLITNISKTLINLKWKLRYWNKQRTIIN